MTTASPLAPGEKIKKKQQQQSDPHGEDKRKKQHKLGMNIRNVQYFGLKHKRFSNRIHPFKQDSKIIRI